MARPSIKEDSMNSSKDQYPQRVIDLNKLRENLAALTGRCQDLLIEISPVVKGANALREVVRVMEECSPRYLCTSRLDQARRMKADGIQTPLMMIRIPSPAEVPEMVVLCDASLNSDLSLLRAINEEAGRQGKTHAVILMQDLGDLREGWWSAEELIQAALEVENNLSHLHLLGVGTNLSCYGSIKPDKRNMQGLASLAQEVEEAIGRPLEIVSGGASTSVYMVLEGSMPDKINHLRLGEIILNGTSGTGNPDFLHQDVFTLRAQVSECREKPSHPVGQLGLDAFGKPRVYQDRGIRRRAIVNVGRVDYGDPEDIIPRQAGIEVLGASSDHTLLDTADYPGELKAGDVLEFSLNYGGAAFLSSSPSVHVKYIQ